ncbi:MAG TPA: hypothetical protein VLC98_06135 [Phnomibacter sp.]|nr:hypothetical protein [Phnomibacter sp.]
MSDIAQVKRRFLNSLKRGTGEAYLILQDYPNIDFSDLIIKGATVNFAYDQQCEGSRAKFVFRLFRKSMQKDKIVNAVLAKLQLEKTDYWSLNQMCDLAVLFFKAGYTQAKSALYNRFEMRSEDGYEYCGQDQLMEMDGINGVLKVAAVVGKNVLEQNDWVDSWHVDNFQKKHKEIAVYNELKKAGKRNKFIAAYYKCILDNKRTLSKGRKFTKFSYDLVKEKIEANKFRVISSDRANDLSKEEVEKLATDFLQEKNKQRQELYFRFFAKRKFPFDYHSILKIASGKNPPKSRLVEFSVEALSFFSGKDIRQLAMDKLDSQKNPFAYLKLLVSNYKKGDNKLLKQIANRSDNDDFIHSIGFGYRAIYEANKTKKCKEPLEILYNKINCGLCRESIVQIMYDYDVLDDKILREIQYDSNEELQKLFRRTKKNGG